ncbi:MAG: glycoside hydrolase family 172 protein [Candidatus Sulfotelmatobacter sp.]
MKNLIALLALCCLAMPLSAQDSATWLSTLPQAKDYVQHRSSSYDRSGGNADARAVAPGETLTLLDDAGPGLVTHVWVTIASDDPNHLKALVLRMYWDGETTPSVETPIGDFFGLGLGDYHLYQSIPLQVGSDKALNCFFPMPFQKHARITVTNEGAIRTDAFYFNIDYRAYSKPLPADSLYFHAQYRQAAPNHGTTNDWKSNGESGRGHFVGVTMSVLQNQDKWWGEGDEMFFVDGEKLPSINGTGSEDYFLGAWDFGGHPFGYGLFGAPVVGQEVAGGRWSLYRFHLDSPITFTKSLKATIEHGHANHRSDNYFSVAYWYQSEPHAAFPALPALERRIPRIYAVGGPGNAK